MTTNEPAGKIEVTFEADGNMNLSITGKINYVQIYGVAALLHEEARVQHAMMKMEQTQKGLVRAGVIPGGLNG